MRSTPPWRVFLARFSLLASLTLVTIALAYAAVDEAGLASVGWNISLLFIGVGAVFCFLADSLADRPRLTPRASWAFLLPAVYVGFQLLPLPLLLLKILSPARAKLVESLTPITHAPGFAPISIHPATTGLFFLRTLAYSLAALVVFEVSRYCWRRQSWACVFPLIFVAAFEACLGILQFANGGDVQGTYHSKDHFTGALEMVLPLAVAYGICRLRNSDGAVDVSVSKAIKACVAFALAAAMLVGLVYSLSKMGFAAGLGALFVMGALAVLSRLNGVRVWLAIAGLGISVILIFLFLPTNQLADAYAGFVSNDPASIEGRAPIWSDSRHLLRDYPMFGTGLGTYETAFLKYQTSNVDSAYTFAHNDYLQLATELGVVGFLIFGGLFVVALAKAVRAAYSEEWNVRLLGLGCTGALTAIGIHSLADFNLYIPANALLLSWIVGISICLPASFHLSQSHDDAEGRWTTPQTVLNWVPRQTIPILFSFVLIVYSFGSLVVEINYEGNPRAESLFCRFGICDPGTVLAADGRENKEITAVASLPTLVDAVKKDPADPERWCDLGDGFLRTGRVKEARYSFSKALTLGPNIPLILVRSAKFYHAVREDDLALREGAHVLENSDLYQAGIFDWYRDQKFSLNDVLCRGLSPGHQVVQSYLGYWTGLGELANAKTTWDWILSHHYADVPTAREYINFLFGNGKYQEASDAWALFLGDRRNGYRQSNWIFNGDFEMEPSGVPLDWVIGATNGQVDAIVDSKMSYTGTHSLRIRFTGTENVNYVETVQRASVPPGTYRFMAYIRTQNITTDKGVAFRILDPENPSHLDTKTNQFVGTSDWTRVEHSVRVPAETKLLEIRVIREPTIKFDNKVSGTVWIDDVSLSKIE